MDRSIAPVHLTVFKCRDLKAGDRRRLLTHILRTAFPVQALLGLCASVPITFPQASDEERRVKRRGLATAIQSHRGGQAAGRSRREAAETVVAV